MVPTVHMVRTSATVLSERDDIVRVIVLVHRKVQEYPESATEDRQSETDTFM